MPSPSKLSVEPKTGPGVARCLVSQSANPSPCRWPDPWSLNSTSIYRLSDFAHDIIIGGKVLTSQLVAVRGTRENIQPCWDCRSAVRRTYLPIMFSDQSQQKYPNAQQEHTGRCESRCLLQNPTIGCACPSPGRAVSVYDVSETIR